MHRRRPSRVGIVVAVGAAAFGLTTLLAQLPGSTPQDTARADTGIHKIRHVIVIMQENESFDSFFGTFPGADGFPLHHGRPAVCVPDPTPALCVHPFHLTTPATAGGPHTAYAARQDIDRGRMDGFLRMANVGIRDHARLCSADRNDPRCTGSPFQVMGYRTGEDIPNYWRYARDFVLQDHMFEPNVGWSLPAHLFMVSGWSARCSDPADPVSCRSDLAVRSIQATAQDRTPYAWTDLTYMLHRAGVSWRYFVSPGTEPDCVDGQVICHQGKQGANTPSIWNPLPGFRTVHQDGQLGNVQRASNFFTAARRGTLSAVSWVVPNQADSDHRPALLACGQSWVTSLIDAVMRGPDWRNSAIFLAWDDWGGLFDQVRPPVVDGNGYGLRVPGLLISPYARRGLVDHQVLSFDAYLKFIEDDFLGGARIDPRTDGRPDDRPDVRERAPQLGDLATEFDFTQAPRPLVILPPYPKTRETADPRVPSAC
jgi:phospholipase C